MLADPALLLHQDAVHHRDLPGRAAERERRDAQPHPESLAKRYRAGAQMPRGGRLNRGDGHGTIWAPARSVCQSESTYTPRKSGFMSQ